MLTTKSHLEYSCLAIQISTISTVSLYISSYSHTFPNARQYEYYNIT